MKDKKPTKFMVTKTCYVSMVIEADDYLEAENEMKDKMSRGDPDYLKALENASDDFTSFEIKNYYD